MAFSDFTTGAIGAASDLTRCLSGKALEERVRAGADGADDGGEQYLFRADSGRGVSSVGECGEFRGRERLERSSDADGDLIRGAKFPFFRKVAR